MGPSNTGPLPPAEAPPTRREAPPTPDRTNMLCKNHTLHDEIDAVKRRRARTTELAGEVTQRIFSHHPETACGAPGKRSNIDKRLEY
ncbi:unnamed protein product [Arctogadus glacialis]